DPGAIDAAADDGEVEVRHGRCRIPSTCRAGLTCQSGKPRSSFAFVRIGAMTELKGSQAMDFRDRHVVITGGTGALGIAMPAALLQAGAVCHVPYRSEDEAVRFPHREHKNVSLTALGDLADEAAVNKYYDGIA